MSQLKILKASAGSGKTYRLTQEYLLLSFKHPAKFGSILAVTFTNKASEEMKSRIVEELQTLAKIPPKGTTKKNLKKSPYLPAIVQHHNMSEAQVETRARQILDNLLHNYSRFAVGTIDSFVQRIIRAFTYELGIQSGYQVEMDTGKVVKELTDMLYRQVHKDKGLLIWLVKFANHRIREGRRWDFREEIRNLSQQLFKEQYQKHNTAISSGHTREELSFFQEILQKVIKDFKVKLASVADKARKFADQNALNPDDYGKNIKILANYLINKIANPAKNSDLDMGKTVVKMIDDEDVWHRKSDKGTVFDIQQQFYNAWNPLLHDLERILDRDYKDYITAQSIIGNFFSFGIFNDLTRLLPQYREENNALLISDTNQLLRRLVIENDAIFIYEKAGNRYENILIDEFQDTSNFQWDNFNVLVKNSLAQGHFNLIVGDVKQSIYRWRDGDWQLLHKKVKESIGNQWVDEETLSTNWRSQANIIAANNAIFSELPRVLQNKFNAENPEADTEGQEIFIQAYADSQQLVPNLNNKTGGRVFMQFYDNTDPGKGWKNNVLEKLSEQIDELRSRGYQPGDIAILIRRNKEGTEVMNALMEAMKNKPAGQQYDIVSGDSLFLSNSKAIRLLISAMYILVNENDAVNYSNLLQLYRIIQNNDEDLSFSTELFTLLPNIKPENYLPAEFIENRDMLLRMSLYELVSALTTIFELNLVGEDAPYLHAFMDEILHFSETYTSDLKEFLEWWNEKGQNTAIPLSEKMNAVRIVTIHKSKGLAYPVVILPFADWDIEPMSGVIQTVLWSQTSQKPFDEIKPLPLVYKSDLKESHFAQDYLDERMNAYMDSLNMLYVAFTRPKHELIVHAPTKSRRGCIGEFLFVAVENLAQMPEFENVYSPENQIFVLGEDYHPERAEYKSLTKNLDMETIRLSSWRNKLSFVEHNNEFFIKSISYIADRVNYGLFMHAVLSRIITPEDVDTEIKKLYLQGQINSEEKVLLDEKINKIIQRPNIKIWFTDKNRIVTERALLAPSGELRIPDRMLVYDDRIEILDFKFAIPQAAHHQQVLEYMKLVADMSGKTTRGFLYYPDADKLVEVK